MKNLRNIEVKEELFDRVGQGENLITFECCSRAIDIDLYSDGDVSIEPDNELFSYSISPAQFAEISRIHALIVEEK